MRLLKDFIEKRYLFPEEAVFDMTSQLLNILRNYEDRKVNIFKAVSVENIFVSEEGKVSLKDENYQETNSVYISDMKNKKELRNDQYSLGIVLIYMLTLIPPETLPSINNKIQFRRETGFNTFFKNFIDTLIEPNYKYRFKNIKKAQKYFDKIVKGKFGIDIFKNYNPE